MAPPTTIRGADARKRVAALPQAAGDRVAKLGEGRIGDDGRHRQVGRRHDRDGGTHADAEQRGGSQPAALGEPNGRGHVATLVRAKGDQVALALAVAAEVELEDVMPLVQPRHERRQLGQPMAAEPVHHDHRGPRLARGGNQPAGEGDAVIGREAHRLVLEADVGRRGRRVRRVGQERAGRPDAPAHASRARRPWRGRRRSARPMAVPTVRKRPRIIPPAASSARRPACCPTAASGAWPR